VLWRRDWKQAGQLSPVASNELDGAASGPVDVGTQTVIATNVRVFNDSVGGYGLIPSANAADPWEALIEITDVQYASATEYNLHYVIGTASSSSRQGNWIVEMGTMVGSNFTALASVDSGSASSEFNATLDSDENLNDNTNLSGLFGGNVGGRLQQLIVDPTDAVTGINIAIRLAVDLSASFAGIGDIALITGGVAGPLPVGELATGVDTNGNMTISWDSASAQVYNVETKDNLTNANWVVSGQVAGDGGVIVIEDTPDQDQLFYKITSE
jgi:hypothetical protein